MAVNMAVVMLSISRSTVVAIVQRFDRKTVFVPKALVVETLYYCNLCAM